MVALSVYSKSYFQNLLSVSHLFEYLLSVHHILGSQSICN